VGNIRVANVLSKNSCVESTHSDPDPYEVKKVAYKTLSQNRLSKYLVSVRSRNEINEGWEKNKICIEKERQLNPYEQSLKLR
jgi:hypothetical protein